MEVCGYLSTQPAVNTGGQNRFNAFPNILCKIQWHQTKLFISFLQHNGFGHNGLRVGWHKHTSTKEVPKWSIMLPCTSFSILASSQSLCVLNVPVSISEKAWVYRWRGTVIWNNIFIITKVIKSSLQKNQIDENSHFEHISKPEPQDPSPAGSRGGSN